MKKVIFLLAILIPAILTGQTETPSTIQEDTTRQVIKESPPVKVAIGEDVIKVESGKEKTSVKVGDKGVTINESGEGDLIEFEEFDDEEFEFYEDDFDWNDDDDDASKKPSRKKFKGHWGGVEIGLNNFITADNSFVLPASADFMNVHSSKSMNFNMNFGEVNLGITRHFGIVSGLGVHWNNYKFDGNNNIIKGVNGVIEPYLPAAGVTLDKSKLTTIYGVLPVLAEVQLPTGKGKNINIAGGVIGAVKLGSYTKLVFHDDGKQKLKDRGDFSLNILRYGFTGRIGYDDVMLYATWYQTPMFKDTKGPELYPVEVGVSFAF